MARVHFIAEARRTSANKYNRKGGNQRTYVSSPYWYNHRFQAPAAETDYAAYHPQASKPALFFLKIPRRVTKTRKNEKKKSCWSYLKRPPTTNADKLTTSTYSVLREFLAKFAFSLDCNFQYSPSIFEKFCVRKRCSWLEPKRGPMVRYRHSRMGQR